MEYEQSNVLKDFPGLYASESQKVNNRESDFSEDEKNMKKDLLTGKRKDKKDRKDKEKGYAALEGESSAEEGHEISPTKSKKTKSFKFASKSKEKREKSRDKEKESCDKKREKDKRFDKQKEKLKSDRKEKTGDIADELPIFGVPLELAVERSRCHDGINLSLPFRACIDYLQMYGLGFEYIYKVSSHKARVLHLKKMYNLRENIDLSEHDVPTVTGLLKMFLRELPEPIFTSELSVRFEEAGAILNVALREKHLKILIGNLPLLNYLLVSWLIVHLYTVTLNEKTTKMNAQNIASTLSTTLQVSQRLITALLCHCPALFGEVKLVPYIPPLTSTAQLPDDKNLLEVELRKQESLLLQIHSEMNAGFVSKKREELLWEVQRITTQLKRKIKNKNRAEEEKLNENLATSVEYLENEKVVKKQCEEVSNVAVISTNTMEENSKLKNQEKDEKSSDSTITSQAYSIESQFSNFSDKDLMFLNFKNQYLIDLREKITEKMVRENSEIANLKLKIKETEKRKIDEPIVIDANCENLDKFMELLHNENQILHIKKINLVRKIMEEQEICIDLNTKIMILSDNC